MNEIAIDERKSERHETWSHQQTYFGNWYKATRRVEIDIEEAVSIFVPREYLPILEWEQGFHTCSLLKNADGTTYTGEG